MTTATTANSTTLRSPDSGSADDLLRREVRAALSGPGAAAAWRALREQPGWNGENDPRPLYRLLGRRRLLAPNWPVAFGGRGLPASSAAIVVEEMIAAGVPEVLHTLSVQICGNFLVSVGTAEQRAATLPTLASGAAYCTVMYTEPDAGSDLARLRTTAEPDGNNGWLITGRKLYSVRTGLADLGLVAARTGDGGSQYQGITLFLVPLTAPGITVQAMPSMTDEAFADVRLDNVRVTADRVIGPVGGGWALITAALALERTGVDYVAKAEAWLRAWCRLTTDPEPAHRIELGRLWTKVQAGRAISRRCVAELDGGQVDPVRAAIAKLWTSQTAREVAWWTGQASHNAGLTLADDGDAARLEAAYREAPGLTISAGTSEMMCELIAAGGLPGSHDTDPLDTGRRPAVDGMIADLRHAIRWATSSTRDRPGTAGPSDDWPLLASLGVFGLRVPEVVGGYGLGMHAVVAMAAELGAAGYDGGLLDTLTAADALAASPEPTSARRHLGQILAGQCAAAMIYPDRPLRPLADPGPDGLLLITRPDGCYLLAAPGPAADGLVTRRLTPAGEHRAFCTAAVGESALRSGVLLCDGHDAETVVTADLLRRAAWLLGAGWAALTATVRRVSTRHQFGKALIDNQSVSFRLATLSAHGRAIGAMISDLASASDAGVTGPSQASAGGAVAEAGRFASDAVREGVQLHGAFGMVTDSPVEALYRRTRLMITQCPPPWTLDRMAANAIPPGERSATGTSPDPRVRS